MITKFIFIKMVINLIKTLHLFFYPLILFLNFVKIKLNDHKIKNFET